MSEATSKRVSVWMFIVVMVVNTATIFYWAGQVSSAIVNLKEYAQENRQQINTLRKIHTKD